MAFRQQALEHVAAPKPLDDLAQAPAPLGWALILGLWLAVAGIVAWLVFGSIATHVPGKGILLTENQAVVYVSALAAPRLHAGMIIHISPGAEKPWEHRRISGRVTAVADLPVTPEQMLALLNNSVLVNYFLRDGPVVALQVQLARTNPAPADYLLSPGALVDAQITTRRQTPLSLAFSR